jgi:4-amino-4-deoxychorismate lyase
MSTELLAALINGIDARSLPATTLASSRGLHYGDGVFRTLLKFEGRLVDARGQLAKLASDAAQLGLSAPGPEILQAEIDAAAADRPTATIKLLLVRSGAGRGYRSTESACERLLLVYPAPVYPARYWSEGVVAFRSSIIMAAQPALAGIKHLNRLEQVLASRDWQDGADEGILCDADGAPVCGSRSNLFWVDGDGLHTPALERCGVAGRQRERILEAARTSAIPLHISPCRWTDLMNAEEAFLSNSLIGIWPLRALDQRRWKAPGPVTGRLAAALAHPRLVA